jgi:uncharacterized protein YjbI with pentapeptide repeats
MSNVSNPRPVINNGPFPPFNPVAGGVVPVGNDDRQLIVKNAPSVALNPLEVVNKRARQFIKQTWVLTLMQENPRGWKSQILKTDPFLRGKTEVPAGYLRDVDLSVKVLRNVDLAGMDLSGKNLSGTDLSGADLRWANFNKADLRGVRLPTSVGDLVGADFSQVNLSNTQLMHVNLTGIKMTGANMRGAFLSDANLTNADLSGAILIGATIENAKLIDTNLTNANMQGVSLRGSDLRGARLDGADLAGSLVTPKTFLGVGSMKHARRNAITVEFQGK